MHVRGTFLCFSLFDPRGSSVPQQLATRAFLPIELLLSTVLCATITYQCDHLSAIRALEDSFDVCTIGVGQAEPKHVQVVLWVFRDAETCAFMSGECDMIRTFFARFS
jgi:hypothetical protein